MKNFREKEVLEERRKSLNAKLAKMGCPGRIPKIGSYKKGEHELLDIIGSYQHSRPFYWIITFSCKKPLTGKQGNYTIKLSTGMVVLPIVNGKLLLKKEFRAPAGKWLWEVPRAFTNLLANKEEVDRNPRGILEKILTNEADPVLEGDPEIEVHELSESWEDSSVSIVCNPYYAVSINGCELAKCISRKRTISWKLFSLSEARMAVRDDHSRSALFALMNEIDFNGFSLDARGVKTHTA